MFILAEMSYKNSACFSTSLWIFLNGMILTANANFNLFMNRSETMRLLGELRAP